jgi:dephospho-CoA kinase
MTHFTVGLTGGIGSGKSTVAKLFAQLGAVVIDTDEIAHRLSEPGSPAWLEVIATFGEQYLTETGTLDRSAIRALIFQNPAAKAQLEAIFHPKIRVCAQIQQQKVIDSYYMIVAPLLFETQAYDEMIQRRLVVDCPIDLQIQRVISRSQLTSAEVEQIIAAQCTREFRLSQADDIIDNSQDKNYLLPQVLTLHHYYKKHII